MQIISDGRTIWVNDKDGMCIGRFSKFGVDVHAGIEGQKRGEHCLDCISGLAPKEAWTRFITSMLKHHGVTVPDKYRPDFVKD